MSHQSTFHKIVSRDKGLFDGKNFLISTDSINWVYISSLSITEQGQLYSSDSQNNHYLLLQSLQSCYIQIYPNSNQQQLQQSQSQQQQSNPSLNNTNSNGRFSKISRRSSHNNEQDEEPPILFIRTFENDKLYIKIPSRLNFGNLLSCLIVWQNLKPQGLAKKWYCENKIKQINHTVDGSTHELLVCRFKVYGPLPSKYSKNLHVVKGLKAPVYQPKIDDSKRKNSQNDDMYTPQTASQASDNVNEGWFYAMGALNSNGVLNFVSDLDGTLLYSIDVKKIMDSEIREIHNSIFNSSNVLFIGFLKELRFNNIIRTTNNSTPDRLFNNSSFLTRDGKNIPSNQRVFIEFPLHIDLEDWFVGLKYFAKREYIGLFDSETRMANETNGKHLKDYVKCNFRVSKKVFIDIIEAKFDTSLKSHQHGKVYAEVRMWGYPWSRSALVNFTSNPFWKEEFQTDLPISTQMIHIIIKKSLTSEYSINDKIVGTVYVTPDILTKQIKTSTTIMTTNSNESGIQISNSIPLKNSTSLNSTNQANLDIVRLTIYDLNNIPIGKLLLQVNLKEYHILSPNFFKPYEKMLVNAPMKDLIKFCNENVSSSDFERVSIVLLDIFQSLNVEDNWFKSLMESELINIDNLTRKSYVEKNINEEGQKRNNTTNNTTSHNNVFNTLFRGSSIFSKSLEKYNLRIGQEYLEKVFGSFFAKISQESKNCEVDPRYVKIQEQAIRKGKPINDDDLMNFDEEDDDDNSTDDEDYDSQFEREKDERIKLMVEENFQNLLTYAEEIWNKIYITSNDLPEQIKTQLKNFRTKVELVCDPNDKTTSLNCLSAFIFLRFFCPAILNPKLFYLAKNHQTGTTQRTLTLIAKILLNLANRQEFSPYKEPHLVKMNTFLRKHQDEVLDYFDKITGRKNDFNEKILDLSHEVKRFDLGLDESSNELPTTPYLIDKYLRLTEIVYLLDYGKYKNNGNGSSSSTSTPFTSPSKDTLGTSQIYDLDGIKLNELHLNEKNSYQIGSLEFEKSEFLDLVGDNETEGFIKSLCKDNEDIFSFINSNITLKDIQKQSTKILNKILQLENFLENYEFPNNFNKDAQLWEVFTNDILSRCYLDVTRNCVVSLDTKTPPNANYKRLVDDHALMKLNLKFSEESDSQSILYKQNTQQSSTSRLTSSFSSNSLGSVLKSNGTKNPFKKWLRNK